MSKYSRVNKKWWDKATSFHAESSLYDLASFKKGKLSLQSTEIDEVGDVSEKDLLHVLCHFGMDTLSWGKLGAHITGVDISESSVKLAQKLSKEMDISGEFICSDIYDLPKVLNKKFDIIFASYGVLLWLSDLKKFAHIIHTFLKPGGFFYIIDLHPFTNILSSDFKIFHDYFDKGPYYDDSPGSYTDWNNTKLTGETYQWGYTMGDIVNAFLSESFHIEFIHEFPFTMYEQYPGIMKRNKKGQYVFKDRSIQIPLLFSLKVRKQ